MTKEEIEAYLNVGKGKEVVVEISVIESLGGMVRTVTIREHCQVRIEFESWGYDEGGIYYIADYSELDSLVIALEQYFGKDISKWKNHTKTGDYPDKIDVENISSVQIGKAFRSDSALLPKFGEYTLQGCSYWKSIIENKNINP